MSLKSMRITAIFLLFLISACGQTGKLYLPEDNEPATQQEVTKQEVTTQAEETQTEALEQTKPRRPERKQSIQRKN